MYFFEWFSWRAAISQDLQSEMNDPVMDTQGRELEKWVIYQDEVDRDTAAARVVASQTPVSRGPVYVYNDSVLEMRCGFFETHRGYVTFFTFGIFMILHAAWEGLLSLFEGGVPSMPWGPDGGSYWRLLLLFNMLLLTLPTTYLYLRYGLAISRLEILTSRHLLIRFNRKTQQVYLHRPNSCGGIAVLPWKGITSEGAALDANEEAGLNVPLVLTWGPAVTQTLRIEVAAVGRRGNNMSELRDEWEFIRRFMDEGPEGLPRPRLTSHFPWPWHAFSAQFEGIAHFLRKGNNAIKLSVLLISPAIVLFGIAHWISLLLCWKPRWPKVIREAGFPGKPTPSFTTLADYSPVVQKKLRENAGAWVVHPGARPDKNNGLSSGSPQITKTIQTTDRV